MGKGIPNSYGSSPVHGKPGNEHVDIQYRDEHGKVEQKEHVPVSLWSWIKPSGGGGEKTSGSGGMWDD